MGKKKSKGAAAKQQGGGPGKVGSTNMFHILESNAEEKPESVLQEGEGVQLAAHFFPKFENTDTADLWETTKEFATLPPSSPSSSSSSSSSSQKGFERGLLATLKHSGHLILVIGLELSFVLSLYRILFLPYLRRSWKRTSHT